MRGAFSSYWYARSVSTREIRTSNTSAACDVCGRTLLRGERAEVYLTGGTRRSVCELCTSRALHEGWAREGTIPDYDGRDASADRRRSLLTRLRSRRDGAGWGATAPTLADELDGQTWPAATAASGNGSERSPEGMREPRHVRAVPTSVEQKVASAIDLFNSSEHRRTIAGVARSLGAPVVCVRPSDVRPSVVNVVVSWELCWYRYEVDLSDDQSSVRVAGQGYELDELPAEEQEPNAGADERGALALGS
jgi:hypothetical protein